MANPRPDPSTVMPTGPEQVTSSNQEGYALFFRSGIGSEVSDRRHWWGWTGHEFSEYTDGFVVSRTAAYPRASEPSAISSSPSRTS
jgi:hypothetical protein